MLHIGLIKTSLTYGNCELRITWKRLPFQKKKEKSSFLSGIFGIQALIKMFHAPARLIFMQQGWLGNFDYRVRGLDTIIIIVLLPLEISLINRLRTRWQKCRNWLGSCAWKPCAICEKQYFMRTPSWMSEWTAVQIAYLPCKVGRVICQPFFQIRYICFSLCQRLTPLLSPLTSLTAWQNSFSPLALSSKESCILDSEANKCRFPYQRIEAVNLRKRYLADFLVKLPFPS